MPGYARRVDGNLSVIIKLARKLGFLVNVRNDQLADLDVQLPAAGYAHEPWEVKDRKGRYTDGQKRLREQGWKIRTVRTEDDVIAARAEMIARML